MKLILKQKNGFIRNVAQRQTNFLEILVKSGVKIYQENDAFFDETFSSENPRALFIKKKMCL